MRYLTLSQKSDFSQSLTQILAYIEQNLNTNPKQGFNGVSVFTNTWKETMTAWHKKQEDRILGLEQQLQTMNTLYQETTGGFCETNRDGVSA